MLCYKATQQGCSEEVPDKKMRKHGSPKNITTDKLPSYGAALREIGVVDPQSVCGTEIEPLREGFVRQN